MCCCTVVQKCFLSKQEKSQILVWFPSVYRDVRSSDLHHDKSWILEFHFKMKYKIKLQTCLNLIFFLSAIKSFCYATFGVLVHLFLTANVCAVDMLNKQEVSK